MASYIRRRKFLATLGGAAAAWPLAARAQRLSVPVIGFLDATTAADTIYRVSAFRDGLKDGICSRFRFPSRYRSLYLTLKQI
jgi:hypothetical protein